MNSSPDKACRRFLLGIAGDEDERYAEEAILAGRFDAPFLQTAEDELIDDYLFGSLTKEERRAFEEHFLTTPERRQRLQFASSVIKYARSHPAEDDSPRVIPNVVVRTALLWKRAAFLASAACVLLGAIVFFDEMRLRRQVEDANKTRDELPRLQAPSSSENSDHSGAGMEMGPISDIELGSTTRSVRPYLLSIPAHAKIVRIVVDLPLPLAARYREVLLRPNGEELWRQEFPASVLPAAAKSTIVLPASILTAGNYHLRLDRASATGEFEESADWVLQVPKE